MKTEFMPGAVVLLLILICCWGCDATASRNGSSGTANLPKADAAEGTGNIRSGNGITIVEGRPEVTQDVKREIYTTLNHRKKMIAGIKLNQGADRGVRQMEDELELLKRSFMTRYDLSAADVDNILRQGESGGFD